MQIAKPDLQWGVASTIFKQGEGSRDPERGRGGKKGGYIPEEQATSTNGEMHFF